MARHTPKHTGPCGRVCLVGAGPGDPGLLTLSGRECIAGADIVFYDALVNPALLAHARPDAEVVFVGKKAGSHRFTQARINAMLAEAAEKGLQVCRLKGGDPFVFGRGGEEALYLRKRGIPVMIVPGVSAAIAVPACAGIPVTHRGCSASVRIITGHEAVAGKDSQLPWDAFARESGTLVVLMGHQNLETIVTRLMEQGMPGCTPSALISNGTLPEQQWVTAPLGSLVRCVHNAHLPTPATLVIGEVVRLSEALAQEIETSSSGPELDTGAV